MLEVKPSLYLYEAVTSFEFLTIKVTFFGILIVDGAGAGEVPGFSLCFD